MLPSTLDRVLRLPRYEKTQTRKVRPNRNISSKLNIGRKFKGLIAAPKPMIRKRLRIQDPIKLPIASPSVPFRVAVIEVINSGSAVPMPTIVRPMTLSGIPICCPISVALSTAKSAPNLRAINPKTMNRSDFGNDMLSAV